jgi:hypothetical protein
LLELGCSKQAFAKIATLFSKVEYVEVAA